MARPIVVDLITRDKSFSRGLGQAERKATGFSRTMGRLGGVIGGALAGGAALAGIKTLRDTSRRMTELDAKSTAVFEGQLPKVKAWADANKRAFGLSSRETVGLAANFADLLKPMGFTAAQAANMSTEVVGLSGALAKWSGGQFTAREVSEKLSKAMLGEREELKGLGISISEADVQARLAKKGQEDLTGAARDQAEAVATQELIFAKSTDAQKAWAAGGRQAAIAQNAGKTAAGEFSETMSKLLTPAITKATAGLGSFATWAEKNKGAVAVLGGAIATVTALVLANAAAQKVKVAWDTASAIASKGLAAGQWAVNAAMAANPIGLVVVAIAALAAGLIFAYRHSETFRKIVDAAFHAVATAARFMWERVLKPTFSFLVRTWLTVASSIVHGAATAFGWVPGLGGKLRSAAKRFDEFKDKVNRSLNAIDDEKVKVTARAGITWTAEAAHFRQRAGRMAAGGRIPGWGGGDRVPILAERGEAVVDKVRTRQYAHVLAAMGVPGFARGGLVPLARTDQGSLRAGPLQQMVTGLAGGLGAAVGRGLAKAMAEGLASGIRGVSVPSSRNRSIVLAIFASMFGWGNRAQVAATDQLLAHESGYRNTAQNPTSTAYGMFQFLNSTWAGTGIGKTSDPRLQAIAGGRYIAGRYGSPVGAWNFWQGHHWYGNGGIFRKPTIIGVGERGPEAVVPLGRVGVAGDQHLHVHIHAQTVIGGNLRKLAEELAPPLVSEFKHLKRQLGIGQIPPASHRHSRSDVHR